MNQKIQVVFLFLLVVFSMAIVTYYKTDDANTPYQVAVVPLDSRPCNTQYVQLLGDMGNIDVVLPDASVMDQFLTVSDQEALWDWMESVASADHMIVYTNELFHGGLIHSRNADAYEHTQGQIQRLAAFAQRHEQLEITVVSILPRLKPSQYDDVLWPYEVELTQWGEDIHRQYLLDGTVAPVPDNVPAAVADSYLALYEQSASMVMQLESLAAQGIFRKYIVGQDDAQQYGPSNMIYDTMQQLAGDHLQVIHGADELTMLLVGNLIGESQPQPVRVVYTNPDLLDSYFPYEAADLATIVADKLAFAGLYDSAQGEDVIIIHNDGERWQEVASLVSQYSNKDGYVAVVDMAYTNKGDIQLSDWLLSSGGMGQLSCYAGWNTASNALGTVLAHYKVSQRLLDKFVWYYEANKEQALQALVQFQLVRLVEDQLYQGHISNELRMDLEQWQWMHYTSAFFPEKKQQGEAVMQERMEPYLLLLEQAVAGKHKFGHIAYQVNHADIAVCYPWERAFEIRVDSDVAVDFNKLLPF